MQLESREFLTSIESNASPMMNAVFLWSQNCRFKEASQPSSTCLPSLLLAMESVSFLFELCLSRVVSFSPLPLLSLENPLPHIPEVKLPLMILKPTALEAL